MKVREVTRGPRKLICIEPHVVGENYWSLRDIIPSSVQVHPTNLFPIKEKYPSFFLS